MDVLLTSKRRRVCDPVVATIGMRSMPGLQLSTSTTACSLPSQLLSLRTICSQAPSTLVLQMQPLVQQHAMAQGPS